VSRRGSPSKRKQQARGAGRRHRAVIREVTTTGDAVAELDDGRCVLVDGVAEGEQVEVELPRKGGRLPRARLRAVLEPSPARVTPPCPLSERCGGCDWMHLSAETRGELHRRHVAELLARATGQERLPTIAYHRPNEPLGYRTRARLAVSAKGDRPRVGFRRDKSRRLVEVDHCPVLCDALSKAPTTIGSWLAGAQGSGEAQVALGAAGRWVVDLHFDGDLASESFATAANQVEVGAWAGVDIWCAGATAPATFGDPRAVIADLGGAPLLIAPGGFAQPSDRGAALLAERVVELVGRGGRGRLVELFAGSGTLSVVLAPLADPFVAVEQSPAAVEQLRDNLAARGLAGKVQVGDANGFAVPRPTATVVLDPPRAGARGATASLVAARPRQIIYVSCNATTLARDLAKLCQRDYAITEIELFELFPQTSHVECVVRLVRGGSSPEQPAGTG